MSEILVPSLLQENKDDRNMLGRKGKVVEDRSECKEMTKIMWFGITLGLIAK